MIDRQISPLRTINTENEALRGKGTTENVLLVNEPRRSGLEKNMSSFARKVMFNPRDKKTTGNRINYSKSQYNRSQSSSAVGNFKMKKTIRQIIDKGVKFNLGEMIIAGDKGTMYEKYQSRLMKFNLCLIILLLVNILLGFIENQLEIRYSLEFISDYGKGSVGDWIGDRPLTIIENALLTINLLLSIASDVLIVMISLTQVNILKLDNYMLQSDSLFSSKTMMKKLIAKLLITSIFYPPGINSMQYASLDNKGNYVYSWNGIITILSMLKIIIVIQNLQFLDNFTNRIRSSICTNYAIKPNFQFILKSHIKQYPILSLLIFFIYFFLLFIMMISNFEYSSVPSTASIYLSSMNSLFNTYWFIFSTMITVAFGDIKPLTPTGYFISIMSGIIGYFLLTLFLIMISNYSEFSFEEIKAFHKVKTLISEENHEKKAMNIVKIMLSLRLTICKMNRMIKKEDRKEKMMKIFALLCHLKVFIRTFHNDYKVSRSWAIPVDDFLVNLENAYGNDCAVINKTMVGLNDIDEEIKTVKSNQEEIEEEMRNLRMMQKTIAAYMINLNNNGILYGKNLTPNARKWTEGSDSQSFYTTYKKRMSPLIKEENEDDDNDNDDSNHSSIINSSYFLNQINEYADLTGIKNQGGRRRSLFQNNEEE